MREHWTIDQLRAFSATADRRAFLKGAAALVGGAALAPYFPGSAHAAVGGELKIMAWEGFTLDAELKDWRKKNGVQPSVSIMATQDDVQGKLVGGTPIPLDVAEYNQGYDKFYGDELKITTPLDESKIPNYSRDATFAGFYKTEHWYWNNVLHGVPWVWGLNSLIYNPKIIPSVATYKDLLKPEYAGKIAFGDDTLATWPMIARVAGLGSKYPNLTAAELDQAFEALKPYRDQSKVFAASNGDAINLLVSGEIGALFAGWSGIPTETAKQNVETRYAVPEEGAAMWCDAWFIPTSATNIDTAYAFINESLNPKVQAEVCKAIVGGSVQKASIDMMDNSTRTLFDYANLDEVFKKAPLQGIPPRASDTYATFDQWVEKWSDFKSGF
ncbi:ABC transporter substrate-binding protein [Rhizobium laguerreae]|uniref:ABC transporter substrate-binding protein n=1 Tax=Rhizobium laguerreae TaxID=1076926 RepID=UPI001C91B625|nr:PotD/PotF family extracellular solute-binding protein [Rhizobium laguerreae]MBY3381826.1 extracellular solute-binding protein [Rhizobium laguerreae]